jgi:hypothetical protein
VTPIVCSFGAHILVLETAIASFARLEREALTLFDAHI